jgi:hypothetical protein
MQEAPRGGLLAFRHHPSGRLSGGSGAALRVLALLEPIAVAVHFEDMDVMGESVEQGAGKALGGEHAGPLVEGKVAGIDG